jgi:hypothetical protein
MGNLELSAAVGLLVLIFPFLCMLVALRSITSGVIGQDTGYTYLWLLSRRNIDLSYFTAYMMVRLLLILVTYRNVLRVLIIKFFT